MEDLVRTVRYKLPKEFLKFKTVRTLLKFCVGPKEVPNFRMIERHYFKGELLRNYDFTFGFCIPNSTNTWEAIYDMPENSQERIDDMVRASKTSSMCLKTTRCTSLTLFYFFFLLLPSLLSTLSFSFTAGVCRARGRSRARWRGAKRNAA